MSELVADMEDWSLQAIVRGSSGDHVFTKINYLDIEMDGQDPFFDVSAATSSHIDHHHQQQQQLFDREFLVSFPDIFDTSTTCSTDELEELYKPFYTAAANIHSRPAQAVLDDHQLQEQRKPNDLAEHKPAAQDDHSDQSSGNSFVAARVTAGSNYTPKYKKRKNQHKRMVIQVSAEGLSSDMWAWRKYGQKPIKGSPYPRSYYRCSSSRGCLARKQVEESCSEPGMFIITYTGAEHSHSLPTRRNSLAGTVRQHKFQSQSHKTKTTTTSTKSKITTNVVLPEKTLDQPCPVSSHDDEKIMKGKSHSHSHDHDDNDNDDFIMSDFVFNEDFFSGFEHFDDHDDGFFAELLPISNANNYDQLQKFPVIRSIL